MDDVLGGCRCRFESETSFAAARQRLDMASCVERASTCSSQRHVPSGRRAFETAQCETVSPMQSLMRSAPWISQLQRKVHQCLGAHIAL